MVSSSLIAEKSLANPSPTAADGSRLDALVLDAGQALAIGVVVATLVTVVAKRGVVVGMVHATLDSGAPLKMGVVEVGGAC